MSKHLQSKSLVENINQAKQRSLDTAMQTLQQQESDFNIVLKNVQKDLRADFEQMSQELIQSCKVESQQTLESLSTLMTSISQSNLKLMITLESQSEKILEQTQHSQASLLTLQSYENKLTETLEQKHIEALETLAESNRAYLRQHKVLTKVPTLILSALTLVLIVCLVPIFVLIDHFELWKKMFGILAMIVVLAIIVVSSWAWYSNTKED